MRKLACVLLVAACGGPAADPVPGLAAGPVARDSGSADVPVTAADEPPMETGVSKTGGPDAPVPPRVPSKAPTIELAIVGDVIFGRYRDDGFDPIVPEDVDPFEKIRPALTDAVVLANLETPVVDALPVDSPSHSQHRFGGDRRHVRQLRSAGVDVVTLANNHLYDLRNDGLRSSPQVLADGGIVAVGAATEQRPVLRTHTYVRDGWRFAFIGITNRLNMQLPEGPPFIPFVTHSEIVERVGPLVEAARADHDVVVVSIHWGDEYADRPAWGQRTIAKALIDRGADVIHGHHPHVLQGVERHGGGLIAYSMGNFLFSNSTKVPRQTGVLRIRFGGPGCIERARFIPAVIDRPVLRPVPATGRWRTLVTKRVTELGAALGSRWVDEGDALVLQELGSCGAASGDSTE